jgi:uncharacterized iron-regulated membrane protein
MQNAGYRTLWRWHFYAGLFVMPLLIVLAVTGTLYCFQPQIEPLLYPHRLTVEPQAKPRLSEDALLSSAASAMPKGATPESARIDEDPARSTEFVFRLPGGERESVYVNPYTGVVLGTLSVEHRFMQVDRMLHRKLLLGKPGELLMELAACWALVMIGTGIALWWPQGAMRVRDMFWPKFSLNGRPWWKSLHAAMGIWLAIGAVAFIVTGLPWTGSWGKNFKALATSVNLGSPPGAWGGLRLHSAIPGGEKAPTNAGDRHHAMKMPAAKQSQSQSQSHSKSDSMPGMVMDDMPLANVPWAVGAVPVPKVTPHDAAAPLPVGRLVDELRSLGLTSDYEIAFPRGTDGVYTVSYFPDDPRGERTLYLDQYSGGVLKDIRYRDYGPVAKAVSYGTSLHMGRYFGVANQIVCTFISLGLAAMAITGFVMWWKRRPAGALGAPTRERARPPMPAWAAALVVLGIIFPLMGATLVAVWALDRAVFARRAARMVDRSDTAKV